MFKKTAIIFAAMTLSVGAASAATVIPGICQELNPTRSGSGSVNARLSFVAGDKCFTDFRITEDGANVAGVGVQWSFADNTAQLVFNGPFSTTGPDKDFNLSFAVYVLDPNFFITSIEASLLGNVGTATGAIASIDEFVWANSNFSGFLANSGISWPGDPEDPDAELPNDNLILKTPSQAIFVQKDIFVSGSSCWGSNDAPREGCVPDGTTTAGVTTFTQRFVQGDDGGQGEVPEPATMLLFSTALLGLGYMRRKKS